MIHTIKDAEALIFFLKKTGFPEVKLIGSFAKGETESIHDIDILLEGYKLNPSLEDQLIYLLEPQPCERADGTFADKGITYTDWGGLYLHNTFFGNIDIFFSIEDFDY